jgi:predicted RNase H-like HicB family nuclease
MEIILNIHIEKLSEGVYLATSESVQGLVAQGRTVIETLEIARDIAKKLIEAKKEREIVTELSIVSDTFDYPLIIGA